MAHKAIFDKKNVLVIGGAGFIGSHLCDELVKHSKVICVDNYISGDVENISHLLQHPNFLFLRHDINEPLDLQSYPELHVFEIEFQGIQEIYYLATPTTQKGFEEHAVDTARTNSTGLFHTLEIAKQFESKVLYGSSRSVYGNPLDGQESFQEDYWGFVNNLSERACYNEGKRFGETIMMTYHRAHNIDTKIARIFNIYGPRMRLNTGRMIPDFIQAAINREDLLVYGDGTQMDSYCYVDDLIQGLVALMHSTVNEPVNLGNPESYRIIDVAKNIIDRIGTKSNILFEEPLVGLIKPAFPDIHRAKQYLGWFPVTEFDIGLQRTIEDMQGSRVLNYQSLQSQSTNTRPPSGAFGPLSE